MSRPRYVLLYLEKYKHAMFASAYNKCKGTGLSSARGLKDDLPDKINFLKDI